MLNKKIKFDDKKERKKSDKSEIKTMVKIM